MEQKNLPELISAKVLQEQGLSRTMTYNLLSNPECGVVRIGKRRFLYRERFLKWLEEQATKEGE